MTSCCSCRIADFNCQLQLTSEAGVTDHILDLEETIALLEPSAV
jgi:hypothetical protein